MDTQIKNTLTSMLSSSRLERIDNVLSFRTSSLTILLDRLHHPHNIAAVLRSADAFGLKTVHLIEPEISSNANKASGISLGTEKWVEVITHKSHKDAVAFLKNNAFKLISLKPPLIPNSIESSSEVGSVDNIPNLPVTELPFEEKICLMFGSELHGLNEELEAEADLNAHIPMYGFVESFNVSVACAICLFCSTINKTSAHRRAMPLDDNEKEVLKTEWIKKSVSKSDKIIENLEKRLT